jgi:uroporphyrinogen decarboxylase
MCRIRIPASRQPDEYSILMTSRELVIKTLNQEPVPRTPRDLWLSSGEESLRPDELAEMNIRYPSDILTVESPPLHGKRSQGKADKAGELTDAWGCVWHVGNAEAVELKTSPLAEASRIASFRPPAELFDQARFAKANKVCPTTSRFVLAWSEVRPFDRVQMLRGREAAMADLARGTKEIRSLLAMLHESACKELDLWAQSEVDGVAFRDDLGSPDGLLVPGGVWRDVFRPMYRDYCKILHARDKFVFFHCDGDVSDIFSDLVKLDIDAIHAQLRLMNLERLAKRYRGRITFWGEIDRQQLQNPGTPEEFRETVLALRRALDFGHGGVIAQCAWDPSVHLQTVVAFFEQWLVPLPMHG